MDTELLVEQKDDGQRLIEQLDREGFGVTVSFWVRTSEDGPWQLFIASPSVEEARASEAYRKLYSSLSRMSSTWVSPSDVKLLNDQDLIAQAAIEVRDRYPSVMAAMYRGKRLGNLTIQTAYIYPEAASPRLSFTVEYSRKGTTNDWSATVRRGPLYDGMRAKGAVSYSTGQWVGEAEEDRKFANVGVLIAIDPKFHKGDLLNNPMMKKMTADQAKIMADDMFKSYNPNAVIVYDSYQED